MKYTCSFHHGTECSSAHNRRERKEAHIDPNGLHETWVDESLESAYARIFGEALEEYNAKQKRDDRKIKSYLSNVRQNTKLNAVYECITQIGNEKVHPSDDQAKAILKDYLESFKKRNASLELVGAYFHADEIGGCPHMHMDYIPVAKGNKTGLKVRNNLNSALKALGYETEFKDGRMISAEMKFQEAERDDLIAICKKYGFEIENPHGKDYCSSKQLREARTVRLKNEKRAAELEKREAIAEEVIKQKEAVEAEKQSFSESKRLADDFVIRQNNPVDELPELQDVSNIGSAEALEQNFKLEKTGTFKKETAYQYADRLTKSLWSWFKDKFYDPLKDKCNKLVHTVWTLKRDNELKKDLISSLEAENLRLNKGIDKEVEERLNTRSIALKLQAVDNYKKEISGLLSFWDGKKTVFNLSNSKLTLTHGWKSLDKMNTQIIEYERLSPVKLQRLAQNMSDDKLLTVADVRKYMKENGIEKLDDYIDGNDRRQRFLYRSRDRDGGGRSM